MFMIIRGICRLVIQDLEGLEGNLVDSASDLEGNIVKPPQDHDI